MKNSTPQPFSNLNIKTY